MFLFCAKPLVFRNFLHSFSSRLSAISPCVFRVKSYIAIYFIVLTSVFRGKPQIFSPAKAFWRTVFNNLPAQRGQFAAAIPLPLPCSAAWKYRLYYNVVKNFCKKRGKRRFLRYTLMWRYVAYPHAHLFLERGNVLCSISAFWTSSSPAATSWTWCPAMSPCSARAATCSAYARSTTKRRPPSPCRRTLPSDVPPACCASDS